MKEISVTYYVSDDGIRFNTKAACMLHEVNTVRVDTIMERLPVRDEDKMGCGRAYIQHDEATFMSVRVKLLEMVNETIQHEWIDKSIAGGMTVHPSWVGRLLDDADNELLRKAWYRIMCVDEHFREWDQPYFANHPEEGTGLRLN